MAFEKTEEGWMVEVPHEDLMGPHMKRLNERQQKFVCALAIFGGDQSRAYEWAGYNTTNARATTAAASRLMAQDAIKEAIREETYRRLDTSSLLAVSTMIELCMPTNPDKKVRLKAAELLTDRTGFHAKTEHKLTIEDNRTTGELMDFIRAAAGRHGLDPNQLIGPTAAAVTHQPVIDADFEEVGDATGLEDIL